ncbi:domain membrane protein [Aspergillus ambiguus]|uniref:domain membrane protein n=1 Tax=Aspergillus ambiguus TaxID=176160 RepID=UPI003CCE37A3
MSDSRRDSGSWRLLDPQNSHEGGGESAPQSDHEDEYFPQESIEQHQYDMINEPTRAHRVRFQSLNNEESPPPSRPPMPRFDSDQSVQSFRSVQPTSARWVDLTDTLHADAEKDAAAGRMPGGTTRSSTADDMSESDLKRTPDRTMSARDRFRAAGELIRQKTVRLGERLGRPLDDGEALGASLYPDDLEGGLPMRQISERLKALQENPEEDAHEPAPSAEAHRLVRRMTQNEPRRRRPRPAYARSGQSTPEGPPSRPESWYSQRPRSFTGGGGILSQLLKLYGNPDGSKESLSVTDSSDSESQVSSGAATPKSGTLTPKKEKIKWYKKPNHQSTASLVEASMNLSRASLPATADTTSIAPKRRKHKKRVHHKTRLEDEIRVTIHIAEILARQRYIMQLCRALMRYGAPTHRLEEYMQMTARVLSVEGQFLYLPGCMIMSFDDPTTRTAEVKLVRTIQGVDLGRLAETHNVYKNVVHDMIGVEEASQELDSIMKRKPRFNKWLLIPAYGMASVAVGPFAFSARPIDMPICFLLGSLVGFMQHVLAPTSVLYSNVFEVSAAVLTSFLARAFGSIKSPREGEEYLFCFSALAQSSIALILPGFMVLCSSLELQSHQMIAGSIRMVFAIIYSLFLGYGITVGTTIYGLLDGGATSEKECKRLDIYGSEYIQHFVFIPVFVLFIAIINQGKWKQLPMMMLIAVCGYITNYFSTKKLGSSSEVANTVGAFTIGLLGNLYSRLWHGHAATAILPAIFVLVPSGLASSGSLIAGIEYADQIRESISKNGSASSVPQSSQDTSIASLGFGMIQVAIGITVGLFIAALVVYPYGKRRSGLFSF